MKTTLALTLTVLAFLWVVAAGPQAEAVVPPPDGAYPNFTTAEGTNALFSLTTGTANTAVGWYSLKTVTTGSFNTGVGAGTLVLNTGNENTAVGTAALLLNTASGNTAVGYKALQSFTTGPVGLAQVGLCTAVGFQALANANVDGFANSAFGYHALMNNTDGGGNTAVGLQALVDNTIGNGNVAIGNNALSNSTGNNNTALGFNAG